MPKAYWIAHVTVSNPDQYKHYASDAPVAFKKYGATFLARGGTFEQMEGKGRPRNVVVEFPSLQAALRLLQLRGIPGGPCQTLRCR